MLPNYKSDVGAIGDFLPNIRAAEDKAGVEAGIIT
jgi:hypothetical protein